MPPLGWGMLWSKLSRDPPSPEDRKFSKSRWFLPAPRWMNAEPMYEYRCVYSVFLFCLHAECDSVNKCIYGCIHAAVERVPIFWCVTSPAAQIWCTRKAQRCMETHLFPVLICMCGAKLDPEAFKSASVSMTVHKSYIINLRKCHEFLHPWRLGC